LQLYDFLLLFEQTLRITRQYQFLFYFSRNIKEDLWWAGGWWCDDNDTLSTARNSRSSVRAIHFFVFHCTHVRMSYVLNSYLLTYLPADVFQAKRSKTALASLGEKKRGYAPGDTIQRVTP